MGYESYWLNNKTDISNFDFSNTLFLTSGTDECTGIPIRKDSLYILHNCSHEQFKPVTDQAVYMQVLTNPVYALPNLERINDYTFIRGREIYQPWATDLLPEEICLEWATLSRKNIVNYVGSVLDSGWNDIRRHIVGFSEGCQKDGIEMHAYGGYTPNTSIGFLKRHANFISDERHIELIKESKYAPQFCSDPQIEMGYIPCRIFKNISYGQSGITNSSAVNRIFNNELIYADNGYSLYEKAKTGMSVNKTIELMKLVKEEHTYINRIKNILRCF
jgi:hypothetical protein